MSGVVDSFPAVWGVQETAAAQQGCWRLRLLLTGDLRWGWPCLLPFWEGSVPTEWVMEGLTFLCCLTFFGGHGSCCP